MLRGVPWKALPPIGWPEDFYLQAVEHAQHTMRSPERKSSTNSLYTWRVECRANSAKSRFWIAVFVIVSVGHFIMWRASLTNHPPQAKIF